MTDQDKYRSMLRNQGYSEVTTSSLKILTYRVIDLGAQGTILRGICAHNECWDAVFSRRGEEIGLYTTPFDKNLLRRRPLNLGVSGRANEKVA
jgi:hypothetical protein